jgi:NADPH2:quinone reductase
VPALTAQACVQAGGDARGSTVLVTGGAGSVGGCAIQLAKFAGARVLASVSSTGKAEVAKAYGADEVINYKQEDLLRRVLELTGNSGVDCMIDVDFSAHLPLLAAAVRPNGLVTTYASMSNPEPGLPFYKLMVRNLTLRWIYVYELPRAAFDSAYRAITAWLESGRAQQKIAGVFDLDQTADAHALVEAAPLGKVLIKVGGEDVGR